MMNPEVMRVWNVISDELQKISLFIFDRRIKYIEVHNLWNRKVQWCWYNNVK